MLFQSLFRGVFKRVGQKERLAAVGKAAESFFDALRALEKLNPCVRCGTLFRCHYKECPDCGETNPQYREFTNEEQQRAESAALKALKELHRKMI